MVACAICLLLLLPKEPAQEKTPQFTPSAVIEPNATPIAEGATCPYQLSYTGEDGNWYRLFTAFTPESDDGTTTPDGSAIRYIPEGGSSDFPVSLFAADSTGVSCKDNFLELVEDYSLELLGQTGAASFREPEAGEVSMLAEPSGALYYKRFNVSDSYGYNVIRWTLHMRNGDTLTLEQVAQIIEQKKIVYSWQDTPMNTAEELQMLFDSLDSLGSSEEYYVSVELPDVTYDEPLNCSRQVDLQGGANTVFADTLLLFDGTRTTLRDINFIGSGGVGMEAYTSVYLYNCSFSGWDTAVQIQDGGWLHSVQTMYKNNGVGIHFDTSCCTEFGSRIDENQFLNNGIALSVESLVPDAWLAPKSCIFKGNKTNVYNPHDYPVDLSRSQIA